MIIVSQDKESIYNFGKIKSIDVINSAICLTDDILADAGVLLGRYATKERAKEVLKEIIDLYKKDEYYKRTKLEDGVYSEKELTHPVPKVYEMPEN